MSFHRRMGAAAVAAALVLAPAFAAAQATDAPPRTAWGDPDLQGVWDYSSITPMQRPERYGDQAFLTEEEAAALEERAVERDRGAAAAPARRAEVGQDVGAYNLFWMDLGTRVVEDRRTSLIIDPPNGRFPAMTPAGAEIAKLRKGFGAIMPADDHLDLGWGDRCLAVHGLPFVPLPYNSTVQFFQTPDYLAIYGESNRIWRIIPIDDRPHGSIRQWLGDARGHWDGDTMVVETTNFSHLLQQVGSGLGIRRLEERFTREIDGVIRYEFTLDDPERGGSVRGRSRCRCGRSTARSGRSRATKATTPSRTSCGAPARSTGLRKRRSQSRARSASPANRPGSVERRYTLFCVRSCPPIRR